MKDITIGSSLKSLQPIYSGKTEKSDGNKGAFGDTLKGAIRDVNQLQSEADASLKRLIVGKSKNLHETMIASEKAGIAFRLMVAVRNKAIESYKEIMRTQL